jgi:hypothetical protein
MVALSEAALKSDVTNNETVGFDSNGFGVTEKKNFLDFK